MHKSFLDALFPKTRQALLAACLLQPDKWWYLSDLAGYLNLTPSTLQRELASLTQAHLLEVRKDGNRTYYKANLLCPGIEDLQSLLIKTAGIADQVKSILKKFLTKIDIAFIYGSLARGEAISSSDVDLMIIGDLKLAEIAPALRKVERSLSREVNVTIYSAREFMRKARNDDAFIKTVMGDKQIFLRGSSHEIEKLVG